MFKFLLISALFLFASANINTIPANATTLFLTGFNDDLKIEDDQDLDKCADVPLITDVEKLLTDLNSTKPNPFALIADVTAIFGDYNSIKTSCPEVAASYEKFFSNVTAAFKNDSTATWKQIYNNVLENFDEVQTDIASFATDIKADNYYNAGEDFGKIVGVALGGYIQE